MRFVCLQQVFYYSWHFQAVEVNPALLFFIMFIDGTWGGFIHVGENILRDGRMGFLVETQFETPSQQEGI